MEGRRADQISGADPFVALVLKQQGGEQRSLQNRWEFLSGRP